VAGLLVTTEAMVAELPKEPAPPMPGGGGRRNGWNGRNGLLNRPLQATTDPARPPQGGLAFGEMSRGLLGMRPDSDSDRNRMCSTAPRGSIF